MPDSPETDEFDDLAATPPAERRAREFYMLQVEARGKWYDPVLCPWGALKEGEKAPWMAMAAAPPAPAPIEIHVATVYHKHGHDAFYGLTRASVDAQVAAYCRDCMDELFSDEERAAVPEGDDAATDHYFAFMGEHERVEYEASRVLP